MDNNAPVIDTKKNAAKFYKVVETYIKRDGINDLMDWLGSTDFFEAPASTRFHGSYEGGLCQHSLNVGKWLNKLAEGLYPGQYTKETLTLLFYLVTTEKFILYSKSDFSSHPLHAG